MESFKCEPGSTVAVSVTTAAGMVSYPPSPVNRPSYFDCFCRFVNLNSVLYSEFILHASNNLVF